MAGNAWFDRLAREVFLALLVLPVSLLHGEAGAQESDRTHLSAAPTPVNGRVETVEGVRVLTVWGTPRERGYAHGRLAGQEIIDLLNRFLSEGRVIGGAAGYERQRMMMGLLTHIAPQYEEELRGMFSGIEAATGGAMEVPALKRKLEYGDLVGINCIPDAARMGCSSFAVWGRMTSDGATLAGRNLDWHRVSALDGAQLVIAHVLPPGERRSWVSVAYPGFIGCLTGMNADGVAVSMHDVHAGRPDARAGFVPRALALRDAIEAAGAARPGEDVAAVLRRRLSAVGNNVPVVFPSTGGSDGAIVVEYDGRTSQTRGVTVRAAAEAGSKSEASADKAVGESAGRAADAADPGRRGPRDENPGRAGANDSGSVTADARNRNGALVNSLICTNHYRLRRSAEPCDRYGDIERALARLAAEGRKLDVAGAWEILSLVDRPTPLARDCVTYHSAVFEPNRLRVHVAFSRGDTPAPRNKPVTLDVARLTRSR